MTQHRDQHRDPSPPPVLPVLLSKAHLPSLSSLSSTEAGDLVFLKRRRAVCRQTRFGFSFCVFFSVFFFQCLFFFPFFPFFSRLQSRMTGSQRLCCLLTMHSWVICQAAHCQEEIPLLLLFVVEPVEPHSLQDYQPANLHRALSRPTTYVCGLRLQSTTNLSMLWLAVCLSGSACIYPLSLPLASRGPGRCRAGPRPPRDWNKVGREGIKSAGGATMADGTGHLSGVTALGLLLEICIVNDPWLNKTGLLAFVRDLLDQDDDGV